MILNSPYITGSLTVTGNATIAGNITVTGSLTGTAATSSFALTLGGTGSVGFASTASVATASGSVSSRLTQIEQVYATTGSNSFRANQSITGSLTVTGQIVAQTLNVQQVTSSIVYSSGSNTFGCDLNSRQTFTGSFYQTGSLAYFSNCVGIGTTNPSASLHTLGKIRAQDSRGANYAAVEIYGGDVNYYPYISADQNNPLSFITGGPGCYRMFITSGGNVGIGCTTPSQTLTISSTGVAVYVKSTATVDSTTYGNFQMFRAACKVGNGVGFALGLLNSAANDSEYSYIGTLIESCTSTQECGAIVFYTTTAGTQRCERLRITSCGKVGIGATDPKWLLEICANNACGGAGQYPAIVVNNSCACGYGGFYFYYGANQMGGLEISNISCSILLNSALCALNFQTLGNNRMTITSGGAVGINCNSPSATLHLNGCFKQSTSNFGVAQFTSTFTPGTYVCFGYGNYNQGMNDNIAGILIITINEPNSNITANNAVWAGLVTNPRGNQTFVAGLYSHYGSCAGSSITYLNVLNAANNNFAIAACTSSGASTLRASVIFIGGGGIS